MAAESSSRSSTSSPGRAPSGPSPTCSSSAARCATRSAVRCGALPWRPRRKPGSGSGASTRLGRVRSVAITCSAMFIAKAAVVGAGTMGGEIAQVVASAGIPVVLKDVEQKFVDQGLEKAEQVTQAQLGGLVKKEKINQEQADSQAKELLGRIDGTTAYDGFGDVDFVIEAVPERMEIKQAVFRELDAATPGHAILASNTSSLSITEIGDATLRPEKVCGFHYFYPASVLPLIEIVEGDDTSSDTISTAVNFAQAIRKQPITCAEVPGFVVNRILNRGVSEIWRAQEEQ